MKNDIATLFSGNRLQNQGAHYTQVRIIHGLILYTAYNLYFNPILHGLFQAGSTQGKGGHKVPAAFFSETVKATAIKLGTLTN